MYAVGRIGSYISRGVCTVSGPFHPFGGVVDIIVVEQPDGSFKSSPWYVKFGKFQGVLTRENVVKISVNEVEANFQMYLNHRGEAYFLREADGEEGESILHPSSSSDEMDEQSQSNMTPVKSESLNLVVTEPNTVDQIDASNEKILGRTNSRRSRILGLVFGRRSMKEERFQEGEGGAGVERASSLDRAEIAADLLEVNWTTNLATKKPGKEKASRLCANHMLDGKADKNLQINEEETQMNSFTHNNIEYSLDSWALPDELGSHNAELPNITRHSSFQDEETSVEMLCMSTKEQVENSTLDGRVLDEKCKVISEISRITDTFGAGNSDHHEYVGVISEISDTSLKLPCTIRPVACPVNQFNEQVFDERNVGSLPGSRSSEEEVGTARVQCFVYCETSESLVVGLDGITEHNHGMMYLAGGVHGEAHVLAETVHAKDELKSEDTGTENIAEDIELKVELVDVPEYQSLQPNLSHSCKYERNEVNFEKSLTVPECYAQMVSVDPTVRSVKEIDSQDICNRCDSSSSSHEVEDENIISGLQFSMGSVHDSEKSDGDSMLRKSLMLTPSGRSEEEQFLFGDGIEFKLNEVQTMKSVSLPCLEEQNHPLNILKSIKEVNGSVNTSHGTYSPSEMLFQDNQSTDPGNLMQKSRVKSSSLSAFGSHNISGDEVGREAKSLPNMWSHIESLDMHDIHHPLIHSLDSNSKSLKWQLPIIDDLCYPKSRADKENQLAKGQPSIDDRLISGELNALCNPASQTSLFKSLSCEGTGDDSASQTSDTEKLNIDRCTSLDSAIVKNDMLGVGISNHYRPCDAAKPVVLGTVLFGSELLFEPNMIAVDQVEKNPLVDPSKSIVTPIESWRSWPFSFGRTKTRKAIQSTPSDVRIYHAEDNLARNIGMHEGGKVIMSKGVKKMLRATTPTSEQLASLNLVEGRNIVTFTFSTSMLGKQQVDARIYMWKWNTRIVISDVDGTITKSDVLGQFMPLVGKDWSQTGVAHLFSAIKENGYQLLFLSARAISQAYLTRRFLLNLKQDGKALPDGPVVISPDGLFPSLFREVIRRAPHEFKITCLEDIKALFPSHCNPFYAGFGNRDTDEISYLKVGIPKGKIFTINPKGEIAVNSRVDSKSYTSLHALVNKMFPPMTSDEQEDFNSWNYWKMPPIILDI